jgi:hypothetical protein
VLREEDAEGAGRSCDGIELDGCASFDTVRGDWSLTDGVSRCGRHTRGPKSSGTKQAGKHEGDSEI